MKPLILSTAALLALGLGATSAHAALIRADSALTGSTFSGSYDIGNAIDGSGLPAGFDETSLHELYKVNNHWTTLSGAIAAGTAWAEFSFDNAQTLNTFYLWNHQSTQPGLASNKFYAVTQFDLEFKDGSGTTLASMLNVAAVGGVNNSAAQAFSFADVAGVKTVRFTIDRNGQASGTSSYTGVAEVAFGLVPTTPIPEPGTYALMLAGLAAVGTVARRRARSGR